MNDAAVDWIITAATRSGASRSLINKVNTSQNWDKHFVVSPVVIVISRCHSVQTTHDGNYTRKSAYEATHAIYDLWKLVSK